MEKKRPYKRINRSYGGRAKKPYIEDGVLYLGEAQKGDLLDLF